MEKKKSLYIVGLSFIVYAAIVTTLIFRKPEGWSFMPASWQAAWSPNYGLIILLLAVGLGAAWLGYTVFKEK